MTILNEGRHVGEYIVSEAEGSFSREEVTVTQTGPALVSGTILGKITASGKYVPSANALGNGAEVASAILYTDLPAATGDKTAVIHARNCEVFGGALTSADGAIVAGVVAELKASNIIVR